ncbi:MAG: hypothetical protein U0736_12310 [Gemmataceae bacterium]
MTEAKRPLTAAELAAARRRRHRPRKRNEAKSCSAGPISCACGCHSVGGSGGQVGPDLVSIGTTAQVDYLLDSLLQPSKAIKENYHATLVTTSTGQQLTGIKVRQTDTALVLRTDQDREVTIPLRDVEEQGLSKVSLMPEGLTDTLTRTEVVDLVRFLSELGKGDRWSVGTRKLARRWQVLQPTAEVGRVVNRLGMTGVAANAPGLVWEPVYSTVAGTLPVGELPSFRAGKEATLSVVRTQLEATAPSKATLILDAAGGRTAWLDGEPLPVQDRTAITLSPGVHTLTLALNRDGKQGEVRLEIEDGAAGAAVRFVGGK